MHSIIISNPVWGKTNCDIFCNYSLKSLLFKRNIPSLLKKNFKITLHILTRKQDLEFFRKNFFFQKIPKSVNINFFFFTDKFFSFGKYSKVTKLQNISIKESVNHDYLIFNYADFIWSDGSLSNVVKNIIKKKVDFLSFFCLPVDHKALKKFVKSNNNINPKQLSAFSIMNLHREAKLRFWNHETFTLTPTFIIFQPKLDTLLISAYHQTILIAYTKGKNNELVNGIKGVTLDEYFSSILDKQKYHVVKNSNEIMVSAICDWKHNSAIPKKLPREQSMKSCFKRLNDSNRKLSENIIKISTNYKNNDFDKKEIMKVKKIIKKINQEYPFNKLLHLFLTNKYTAQISQIIYIYIYAILRRIFHFFFTILKEIFMIYGKSINWVIYFFDFVVSDKYKKKKLKIPKFKSILNSYRISILRLLTLK